MVEQARLKIEGLKLAAFDRETASVCCSALAAWIPPVE
jgi:hypothetical protein